MKPAPRLTRDRFDAIVVGAGISGVLVAEALTRAGKSVLILDRWPPVRSSTTASTAMIQHEIDMPLTRLRRKIGADHADRAWLRSVLAVAILSRDSASANPAQLTAELPGGVALAKREGQVLVAEHAVFCTGYEYLPQMKVRSHHITSPRPGRWP